MKRIIPILLTMMIIFSLAVPAFAAENDPYFLIGEWTFNTVDSISMLPSGTEYAIDFVITTNMWTVTGNRVTGSISSVTFYDNTTLLISVGRELGWRGPEYSIITISGGSDISNETFANWLKANAVKTIVPCDGSCPFTDANGDSYCDVCGGFFTTPLLEVVRPMQGNLKEVLTPILMILPIGLACWVGYKGLRKALALLQRILHQA